MRFRARHGAVFLLTIALGCGGSDDGGNNPPPANTFNVQNNSFNPTSLTVASGTQITFNWVSGAIGHNVTPSSANPLAAPESGGGGVLRSAPFTFTVTFNTVGTFRFFCSAHGAQTAGGDVSGMSGTIVVQ